jgi:hypothetical protein
MLREGLTEKSKLVKGIKNFEPASNGAAAAPRAMHINGRRCDVADSTFF